MATRETSTGRPATAAPKPFAPKPFEPMTADEYRAALARLGFAGERAANDEGISAAGRFFHVDPKTGRVWAANGPPAPVAIALRLMLALKLTHEAAERLLAKRRH